MTEILNYINNLNAQVVQLVNQGNLEQAVVNAQKAVQLCTNHQITEHPVFADSLNNLAELYRLQGHYTEAEPLYQQVLKIRINLWGEEHPNVAESFNNLGTCYFSQAKLLAAEQNLFRALNLWKRLVGNKHPQVAICLNNIAQLYQAQGNYLQAENLYKQALEIQNKLLDFEHHDIWRTLNNLATIYKLQGRYQEAEKTYIAALEMIKNLYGNEHPDVAVTLNNLAGLYNSQGLYTQAEINYLQALESLKPLLGDEHPYIASTLNDIAENYKNQGRYLESEKLHLTVWQMRKSLLGNEHPDTASSLNSLGELSSLQGRYLEAEEKYLSALTTRKNLLAEEHPDIAISLNNLALLYTDTGRYSEAESLYLEALKIGESTLSLEHPEVAKHLNNLAVLYEKQGRYAEAEQKYLQALNVRNKVLGNEHPKVADTLNDIAGVYRLAGRYSEAEQKYLQALAMRKTLLGEAHPDVAASLNNLAVLYNAQGKSSQAESLFLQVIAVNKNLFGEVHPQIATTLSNLATIYSYQGRYNEAEKLHLEALRIKKSLFGQKHPQIARSYNNLAETYFSLGSYQEAEENYLAALEMRKSSLGEEHPDVAASLNNLATVLTATNHYTESLSCRVQASYINDKLISKVFAFSSESDRLALIEKLRVNLDLFLSLVYQHLPNQEDAKREAFNFVLKRKGLTAASISAQNRSLYSDRYPHLQTQFHQLCDLNTQLINSTFSPPKNGDFVGYQSQLSQLEAEYNNLQKYLASQVPEIQVSTQIVDCGTVAKALPANSILVEFVRFDVFDFHAVPAKKEQQWHSPRYLAFVLPSGQPNAVQMIDLGEVEVIDNLIGQLQQQVAVSSQATMGFGKLAAIPKLRIKPYNPTAAIQLSKLLFQPIQEIVKGYQHLIFAPDGNLNLLPLQVLPLDETNTSLLMDEYTISYLSVGHDVMRYLQPEERYQRQERYLRSAQQSLTLEDSLSQLATSRIADSPLILADPDFDLSVESTNQTVSNPDSIQTQPQTSNVEFIQTLDGETLSRAIGTKFLAESVAKKLKNARLYLGKEALFTHLTNAKCPSIMLIATHGLFLPNSPPAPPQIQDEELNQSFATASNSSQHKSTPTRRYTNAVGIANAKNPMLRSLLALAGANTWLSSGTLPPEAGKGCVFAQDIANLDLWANELTVLSACDTAKGDITIGEGVFGLRRAFTVAGTKTLVMSLWKVPDKATALLMERFFDNLQSGMQYADALRNAQNYTRNLTVKELRQSSLGIEVLKELLKVRELSQQSKIDCQEEDTPLQHPFYWGAWICQGALL
jgi:tetratricopeptide (TPR) repeat protein